MSYSFPSNRSQLLALSLVTRHYWSPQSRWLGWGMEAMDLLPCLHRFSAGEAPLASIKSGERPRDYTAYLDLMVPQEEAGSLWLASIMPSCTDVTLAVVWTEEAIAAGVHELPGGFYQASVYESVVGGLLHANLGPGHCTIQLESVQLQEAFPSSIATGGELATLKGRTVVGAEALELFAIQEQRATHYRIRPARVTIPEPPGAE